MTTITDLMIMKQATCPHWNYFDLHGDAARRGTWQPELFSQRLADEANLAATRGAADEPEGETSDERAASTLELMRRGVALIYRPTLIYAEGEGDAARRFVSEPDCLERRGGAGSDFGDYHYVAIDVRGGERPGDALKDLAAFHAELLAGVQGYRPTEGYILTAGGALLSFPVEEAGERLLRSLDEIDAAVAGEIPPPHLGSACKRSPWFDECVRFAEATDDIALLYNVRKKEARALRAAGFDTVEAVRAMDVAAVAGTQPELTERFLERVKLQATALKEGRHFVRHPYILETPPLELFFDIEADPTRGQDYLYGFTVRDAAGTRHVRFLAEGEGGEERMWREFLRWYGQLPHEAAVYHFGDYERQSLATLEARYGGSKPLTRFRRQMRDLNEIVKDNLVLPLYFYGLKNIGCYVGYERSCGIAGGAESVDVYDQWRRTGDQSKLDALLEYNREDCEATMALRDWLAEQVGEGQSIV
jgi:uncharacterized protein